MKNVIYTYIYNTDNKKQYYNYKENEIRTKLYWRGIGMKKRGRRINERKGVGGGESGSLDNFHNGSFRRRYPKFQQIVEYIVHLFADCRCQLLLYRQLLRSADGRKPKDSKRAPTGILWSTCEDMRIARER